MKNTKYSLTVIKPSVGGNGTVLMGQLLPLDGVKGNSPGLFHALPQEDLAVCPVQIGNLDA